MKIKLLFFSIVYLLNTQLYAQIDRTKAPISKEIPTINFGKTEQFSLKNGIKVIVVENHKLPLVSVDLSLDIPPIVAGKKAGYFSLIGDMMRAGTQKYSKEQIDEKIDFIGSDFWISADNLGTSSLNNHLEESLALLQEIMLYPSFINQEELDKLISQNITALESDAKNPDAIMARVKNVLLYGKNHPKGEYPTAETFKNITLADLKTYYKQYFVGNNAYLTIIGDITPVKAKELAQKYFAPLPAGVKAVAQVPAGIPISQTEIDIIDLPSATQSVISVTNLHHLDKKQSDYFAAGLSNFILGGGSSARLFKNIREDKGWTYGAYSRLYDSRYKLGTFSASTKVRNNVTDSTVVELIKELKNISQTIDPKELQTAKAERTGQFAMSFENPETISDLLLTEIQENLPKGFYQNYLSNLNNLTGTQLINAAKNYIKPEQSRIIIVGKATEITANLKKLGYPIHFFDSYGNPTEDPTIKKEVNKTINATNIIENYIQKIGGKEKLVAIKNYSTKYIAKLGAMDIEINTLKESPNKFVDEALLLKQGISFSKVVFDGKKGYEKTTENVEPFDANKIATLASENSLFPQLNYDLSKIKVLGIKKIHNQEAYELEIDDMKKEYYDTETGLLLSEIKKEEVQTDKGKEIIEIVQNFSDYRTINGILFPYLVEQIIPDMPPIEGKLEKIDFNIAIDSKFYD